jgi:hypothetical protein
VNAIYRLGDHLYARLPRMPSWARECALEADDDAWNRARGYALHQAALIIPYYTQTNPGFATQAKRTVEQVLADVIT